MRRLIGLLIGAVIGGFIGYSQVICPSGQCAMVGSWYGGAVFGGLLGLLLAGGCPACAASACETEKPQEGAEPATRPDS